MSGKRVGFEENACASGRIRSNWCGVTYSPTNRGLRASIEHKLLDVESFESNEMYESWLEGR